MARLAEQDRERTRYHLGYLNIDPVASIQLGFPSAQQAGFLVESAMDRLIPSAVSRTIRILNELDSIELQMSSERSCLKVQQIETLKFRNDNEEPNVIDLLEREYLRWAQRLADQLGVPLNLYSARFSGWGAGGLRNVPVAQV